MYFGKIVIQIQRLIIYFVYTLNIYISVTSCRPLESDELNRSVPSLMSSLVIDSDDSPTSVADSVKGPSRRFLTSTPNRLVSSIHFQCIS